MQLGQLIYATCSAAFVALIALMLLRRRISGPGIAILAACVLTAAWSADLAFSGLLPEGARTILDGLRLSAWLIVLGMLIGIRDQRRGRALSLPFVLTVGFCLAVAASDTVLVFIEPSVDKGALGGLHDLMRVGIGVAGLLATENLLRNAELEARRRIWPFCLAMGATFAFELFLYAERLMVPGASSVAAPGRALVGLFAVPLLAVAMARNRDWRIDIHVSRTMVLHTAALVASGVFCMSLAAAGLLVRELGGAWGPPFELLTLLGSAIVLVAVMGSRDLRVHLKRFVERHFYSHRFDYRTEWLRFVETVSQPGAQGDSLQLRVVRALAQIVDSPAGSLWCSQDGRAYVPTATWNLPVERGLKLPAGHPFLAGFRNGAWIQERPAAAGAAWPFDPTGAWVAIPLAHGDALIAFVILAPPSNLYPLDWETFDLLRAAGRQAASYLAEERSARALGDTRALNDFSKRFAFVVHDFKNLASQLGMVVANARRHMDNPEFRSDMLETLESSLARMNRLIEQMRAGARQAPPQVIEPDIVIADLEQELSALGISIQLRLGARDCKMAIDRDQFRSLLLHLINNAREAAPSASEVIVASLRTGHQITIDVIDAGPGMDDEFIREEFLRPFRSTKSGGMGIGGYQIREMLRLAGGELDVISAKGVGTVIRCMFPMHDEAELVQSAA
ncbi:MAG: XrtA/PEP-CTERM system histidine kinase PrsK [Alphaproteobacteria bacterium]